MTYCSEHMTIPLSERNLSAVAGSRMGSPPADRLDCTRSAQSLSAAIRTMRSRIFGPRSACDGWKSAAEVLIVLFEGLLSIASIETGAHVCQPSSPC
jgi:hypothetical protein